jgi:hypothetical protein
MGGAAATTTYAYNDLNQQISVTDANSNTYYSLQDPNDNIVESIDVAGDATTNYYNAVNELIV